MNTFPQRLQEAEKRVAEMDSVDGWKDRNLTTILAALEAGLKNPISGGHYDAYVMLRDIVQR